MTATGCQGKGTRTHPPRKCLKMALEATLGMCPVCQRHTRILNGTCKRRYCIRQGKARDRYRDPGLLARVKNLEEAVHAVSGEGDSE